MTRQTTVGQAKGFADYIYLVDPFQSIYRRVVSKIIRDFGMMCNTSPYRGRPSTFDDIFGTVGQALCNALCDALCDAIWRISYDIVGYLTIL